MNSSLDSRDDPPLVLSLPPIPQLVILGIIFIASVILNCISIISIVGARAITPINLLIINLAVSDIVYSLTIPIFAVHIVIPWWPFGRVGCQLVIAIDIIAMIVGVYTITALSIERYMDVRETSRRYNDQVKSAFVLGFISLLWLFAILFPLPMSSSLFVHDRTRAALVSGVSECRSHWTPVELSRYVQLKFVCAFLLPSLITCIFSFLLIIFLHRWSMRSRCLSLPNNSVNNYKRRATTLVLLIIISFFVLWSPLWILQLYDTFNERGPTPYIQILNFLTLVFVYANGLLNPLLYLILTQNFRDYMRRNKWSPWKRRKQSRNKHHTLFYTTTPIINENRIRDRPTSFIIHHDDDQHAFVPTDGSSEAI
ncbi:unnamed protein product [Rotaria magnacalcarata]|uniref:G-protein coupled receptors family 1 profile domain-containing protein n=4 Tax=Rotaria magnacalcarata TaxID=392030 RepID=A0A814Q937_9BILA|nr:unnamed protein product [Rotaria magnacalcarata]CAF1650722.1 unnamed protein product [Rotaria magnacalcarata]CAF2093836.1 unnamed protein product [Rotaria magnacalcarata]CAF2142462.1 unnamed protein product [Rotaria magnacalcarata]CAF2155375.1 unnamed protein product [Rotaria magnacalcarata]